MSRPIFLSYRRSDSGEAGRRLYQAIRSRFGSDSIYMDTASTAWGEEWPSALEDAISTEDVVIVLIGPDHRTGGTARRNERPRAISSRRLAVLRFVHGRPHRGRRGNRQPGRPPPV